MHKKYDELIWFLRGSQRKRIFLSLPEKEFIPNKLRKQVNTKISLREMSRHLKDFKEKEYIKCLNETDPYNKLYILTKKGKKMQKQLESF